MATALSFVNARGTGLQDARRRPWAKLAAMTISVVGVLAAFAAEGASVRTVTYQGAVQQPGISGQRYMRQFGSPVPRATVQRSQTSGNAYMRQFGSRNAPTAQDRLQQWQGGYTRGKQVEMQRRVDEINQKERVRSACNARCVGSSGLERIQCENLCRR